MRKDKEKHTEKKEKHISKSKKFIFVTAISICIMAAVAALFFLTGSTGKTGLDLSLLDFGTVMQGVHVAGIDISGMTKSEALEATAGVSESILSGIKISLDINGETLDLTANEAGLDTDYEDVINYAISYGHTGNLNERARAAYAAKNGYVNFAVTTRAMKESVLAALLPLKEQLDKQPVDAGWQFTPKGHFSNGKEYDSKSSEQLVRISADDMPNALRYKYYKTKSYVKDYVPSGANISRFVYTNEEEGRIVDIESVAASVINEVKDGNYSTITAPVQILEPQIYLDTVKHETQLISSWTSSYESHDGADRNYNIAKLSGIINGVIIKPGEIWSINDEAGPRTYENGWKGAAGINGGAFVIEPGGGVCQISSTLYNAALRAGLEIVESSRHSIISNYMPLGLDATISTGGKDLKLKNPYSTPVFIVSYVNKSAKNVTVEIYGPPVTDGVHGEVILDFTSKLIERTETPKTVVHYNAAETPDGKPIDPGDSKMFVTARRGTKAQVYIHYISPDGKELEVKELYIAVYPKITGHKYVNDSQEN